MFAETGEQGPEPGGWVPGSFAMGLAMLTCQSCGMEMVLEAPKAGGPHDVVFLVSRGLGWGPWRRGSLRSALRALTAHSDINSDVTAQGRCMAILYGQEAAVGQGTWGDCSGGERLEQLCNIWLLCTLRREVVLVPVSLLPPGSCHHSRGSCHPLFPLQLSPSVTSCQHLCFSTERRAVLVSESPCPEAKGQQRLVSLLSPWIPQISSRLL